MVVIINDPIKGLSKDNLIAHEGNNTPCKHLLGDKPGKYLCAVHDAHWYKKTPCFSHGQIEALSSDLCRIGVFVMKNQTTNLKELI